MLDNKFFKSILYFSIISAITCIFWYFGLESIGLPLFTGIAVLILIFDKNGINVVPFLLNMLFMISRTEWSMDAIPIYLYILPPLFLLAMIFHMIKNKIKLFDGKLKYPLLMLLAAMLLSTINAENFTIGYVFYYFIGIFYLFIYFFFKGSLKGDNLEYLIRLFAVLGVMISVQILLYFIKSQDDLNIIRYSSINLGWGVSNFVATYLLSFMIVLLYYIRKGEKALIYLLLLSLEIAALILTASKGAFLTFGISSIILFFFLIYKNEKKFKIIFYSLFSVLFISLIFFLFKDYFIATYHKLFDDFFNDNSRFELWYKGISIFLDNVLFGGGIFSGVDNLYFRLFHNTIIHTLATLGLFGLFALIWQIMVILNVFLRNTNDKKIIFFIIILVSNIHGMIDNVYYMPQFMVLFFIIISATENYSEVNSQDFLVNDQVYIPNK